MAKIALNFEDGVTRFIESNSNETIAEAAYRVGVNIPLDCADGACGTCKCLSKSGSFDPGDYIEVGSQGERIENAREITIQAGDRLPPTSEKGNTWKKKRRQ